MLLVPERVRGLLEGSESMGRPPGTGATWARPGRDTAAASWAGADYYYAPKTCAAYQRPSELWTAPTPSRR